MTYIIFKFKYLLFKMYVYRIYPNTFGSLLKSFLLPHHLSTVFLYILSTVGSLISSQNTKSKPIPYRF